MSTAKQNILSEFNGPLEEAYRVLRSNIRFCAISSEIRTITVTSCNPGEGKTTTALNLSISMAKAGFRVLLVDADLRKPKMAGAFESKNDLGLTDLISGNATFEEVTTGTYIDSFCYIGAGDRPPNPAELLGSARFAGLLGQMREMYDMVIIDTPPLGSVIDSAIIAAQTDGTLLVVKSKGVRLKNGKIVKEQLEKANANILGVVLNSVDKGFYKSYYSYYDYYGKVPKKGKR